jgi:DNA polymerase I-like protein with 3'-5' exonuclease and polymerase domains
MDETKLAAHEQGFVETLFGRRLYINGIKSSNQAQRGFAERQAINAPIQGTAAGYYQTGHDTHACRYFGSRSAGQNAFTGS